MSRSLRSWDEINVPVALSANLPTLCGWPTVANLRSSTVQRVTTTWRELLLASVEVGRPLPIRSILTSSFVRAEVAVRINSLKSLLAGGTDASGEPVAVLSDWALAGADGSELGAASYRLGMAAAHWIWRHQLGMSGTDHVRLKFAATHPIRGTHGLQADLFGVQTRPLPAVPWLIEAKGSSARRVPDVSRTKAVEQLAAARNRGWRRQQGWLLVCAATRPFLHLVIDMTPSALQSSDLVPSAWPLSSGSINREPRERFLRRVLVGALLLQGPVQQLRLPSNGTAYVVQIGDADVFVGLTRAAADMIGQQLSSAQRWLAAGNDISLARGDERLQEALIEYVLASEDGTYQFMDVMTDSDDGGVVLFDEGGPGWESGAVVNDVGIVVALGSSWQDRRAALLG